MTLPWHDQRIDLPSSESASVPLSHRGGFVVIAGPDGSGKTRLTDALRRSLSVRHEVIHIHHSPGFLPKRVTSASNSDRPHSGRPYSRPMSLLKTAYLFVDFQLGWLLKLRPHTRRGGWVLLERGWWDIAIDPKRYRLRISPSLVRALARWLPRADLVIVLEASPRILRARKNELPLSELARQMASWRVLAAQDPARFVIIDASMDAHDVLERALAHVRAPGVGHPTEVLDPRSLAVRCLGAPSASGRDYVTISVAGTPRWLLPRHLWGRGPLASRLYRRGSMRGTVGAVALEAAQRLGGHAFPRVTLDPALGLAPEVANALCVPSVELAAALPRDPDRLDRAVFAVRRHGSLLAFAKIQRDGGALCREADILQSLVDCRFQHILVPRVLAFFEWRDCQVLLLQPLPTLGRTDRPMGMHELNALAELPHVLHDKLATILGTGPDLIPVHGDFCGWNSAPVSQRLAIWDWEELHLGFPFEDLFHWRVQRLVYFGKGEVSKLVHGALRPDQEIRYLSRQIRATPDLAPLALGACLRRGLAQPSRDPKGSTVRQRALALLEQTP